MRKFKKFQNTDIMRYMDNPTEDWKENLPEGQECPFCIGHVVQGETHMIDGVFDYSTTSSATCPVCKARFHYDDRIGWGVVGEGGSVHY